MVKKFLIEAVVDSLDAALAAQAAGADRLELCSALELGGLTPGAGLMQIVCAQVRIPVHILLRTRSGDFECTQAEFETLLLEVKVARLAGAEGIVVGILLPNGRIDVARMRLLVEAAAPMSVTFHRAFDRLTNRNLALADLLSTGCQRLLSSGLASSAEIGGSTLQWLRAHSNGWLVVMPGGGITADNAAAIALATGAIEFHFSAIAQDDNGRWEPNPDKVRAIKAVLETYFSTTD
jgi:copper homeostasis protein